jgi:hypothetical protein
MNNTTAAATHDTNDAKRRLHHEYTSHNSDSSLQCDSYLSLHLLLVRFKQQRHKHTQAALKPAGKDTKTTLHNAMYLGQGYFCLG